MMLTHFGLIDEHNLQWLARQITPRQSSELRVVLEAMNVVGNYKLALVEHIAYEQRTRWQLSQ